MTEAAGSGKSAQDALMSPLDLPQEFAQTSSYEVRDELMGLIERDLLGPWDGELEVFPPRSPGPLERYLVGRLGPKREVASSREAAADAVDAELSAGGDASDGELPDLLTMQNAGRMWASSMGLSFVLAAGADELSVTASWGRYSKSEQLDEAGNPRRVWGREPLTFTVPVRLDGQASQRVPLIGTDPRQPGVHLAVEVRPRPTGQGRVVELGLVNALEEPAVNKDTAWLFQPTLTVRAAPAASATGEPSDEAPADEAAPAVFLPIDDPLEDMAEAGADPEERHLRLLYRDQLRHAVGRNVAVRAEVRDGERRAHLLRTTWLPVFDVPATIAPPAGRGSPLAGTVLSMDDLASLETDLAVGLGPLAARGWTSRRPRSPPCRRRCGRRVRRRCSPPESVRTASRPGSAC